MVYLILLIMVVFFILFFPDVLLKKIPLSKIMQIPGCNFMQKILPFSYLGILSRIPCFIPVLPTQNFPLLSIPA